MHLRLREHRKREAVGLSANQVNALRGEIPSVTVEPSSAPGMFDITPGSVVGALTLGDLRVEIEPKVGISRVLYLASVALDRQMWRQPEVDIASDEGTFDAVADLLCLTLEPALAAGMVHGYRGHEEALSTVRGRIQFSEQMRRRPGQWLPVECAFDEFTEDIELNRQIRAALEAVLRLPLRSQRVIDRARALRGAFLTVELVRYHPLRIPVVTFTRLNSRFRAASGVAQLILRLVSPEHGSGTARSQGFLLDMNQVFEDFVTVALRSELRADERSFPQNARGRSLHLDDAARVRLEPDLSWWGPSGPRFVGDVKYKRIDPRGIKHADLYQLLAYTIATQLPGGMLIYAAGELEDVTHDVGLAGKRLSVRTLDVGGPVDSIGREIAILASEVRRMSLVDQTAAA